MNAETAKMMGPKGAINPTGWKNANKAIAQNSAAYRAAAASTGMFEATQMRVSSATDDYIKKLEKQKVTFRDMWKDNGRIMKAAYREQLRMQQMTVRELPGTDARGRKMYDVTIPSEVHKSWDTLGQRIGFVRENLRSASIQLTNWGKNTQWAGRQMMVGLTMPLVAFGAVTGKLAYDVDKQLTRITKVYNTTANQTATDVRGMAKVEQEYAQVRANAWAEAETATMKYAAAAKDTLDVTAQLAAQGLKGSDLTSATDQIMRISSLGEMDAQTSLKAYTSLMNTMGMTAEQVGHQFDYMNAVENATSLSTQDFATAIPIALGPLKEMGGDVQDLGLLMTAFAERSIPAAQGANAIKSMMQRLYRPSQQIQEEWSSIAKIDLMATVEKSGGNVMKILSAINGAIEGLNRTDRVKLLGGLFGTYQVARQNAILKGLQEVTKGGTQMAAVMKLNGQSWQEWGDISNRELKNMQESVSFRFKKAVEDIKNQLADMGPSFLEMGTKALGVISTIIDKLSAMPDGLKSILKWGGVGVAVIGPLTMLVGLMANFMGTMGRMGVSVLGLFSKFEILNKETAAGALTQKLAEKGFLSAGQAASLMTQQLQKLVEVQMLVNEQMGLTAEAAAAGGFAGIPIPGTTGRYAAGSVGAGGQKVGGRITPIVPEGRTMLPIVPPNAVADTSKIADESERGGKAMKAMAVSSGVFGAAMAASMISSNHTVDNLAQMAMIMSVLTPAIAGAFTIIRDTEWAKIGSSITSKILTPMSGAAGSAGLFARNLKSAPWTTLKSGATSLKTGMAAVLSSSLGIGAALAAAAAAGYLLYKQMSASRKEAEKTYEDVSGLGKIYGYTPTEQVQVVTDKGTQNSDLARVQAFREAYGGVVEQIKNAKTDQEAFNYAMAQGLKVISSGGTAEEAKNAVHDAIAAAKGEAEAQRITLKFKAQLDFTNAKKVMDDFAQSAMQQIQDSMTNTDTKGFWEKQKDSLSGLKNVFGSDGIDVGALLSDNNLDQTASDMATEAAKTAANSFYSSFATAVQNHSQQGVLNALSGFQKGLEAYRQKIYDLQQQGGNEDEIARITQVMNEYVKAFAAANGVSADDLQKSLTGNYNVLTLMGAAAGDLTAKMKLTLLESQKGMTPLQMAQAGGLAVQAAQEGTAKATKDTANNMTAVAAKTAEAAASAKAYKDAFNNIDWGQQLQGVFSSVQGQIADIASSNFENQMNAAMDSYRAQQQSRMDAMQNAQEAAQRAQQNRQEAQSRALSNRQEAETAAFEKRWERRKAAVAKAYDDRIARINKEIAAEQKAEDVRQRIFEAEQARISRLNETANSTIDFNVALDQGQLDEAAKIRNDMQAQQEQWNLQDQNDKAARRSQQSIDRLQKQVDQIDKIKEKRLKAIEEVEARERKSLERMQAAQTRALQKRQEAEQRALQAHQEAAQKALQKEIDNNIAAQQEIWDNRKEKLDKAIELFQAYVPKNEKDLRQHVANISKQYKDFNVTTTGIFDKTSVKIGEMLANETKKAALSIKSDIQWEAIGDTAARRMIQGALGMTWGQFKDWMTSGNWPKGAGDKPKKAGTSVMDLVHQGVKAGHGHRHTGGWVDGSPGSRKGVSRTSPQMHNERLMNLRDGEYVVNDKAAKANAAVLEEMNKGKVIKPTAGRYGVGGGGSGLAGGIIGGFASGMGAILRQGLFMGIQSAIAQQNNSMVDRWKAEQAAMSGKFGSLSGGVYGDIAFDAEQLKNARIIASVGKSMKMSARDIEIGIMTAITESSLRNIHGGDRDSQGLFQQRPSMGWGTVAQVTDPQYAAHKFFSVLKGVAGRGDMAPWLAAQAVQRSAYSDGSNYHPYWNEATAIFKALQSAGSAAGGFVQGGGGRHRPVPHGYGLTQGIHDSYTGFPAVDFGVPVGTSVFAAADGRITRSYDIRGYEPRNAVQNGYRSYGRVMEIDHGPFSTLYAHLSQRLASAGKAVKGGALIGKSGNTGHSTGPHLHFGAQGISPMAFVGLSKGAENIRWDNTIANLHHGETVLTEDLSKQFKQGVANFANGGNSEYNVNVNIMQPGATAQEITRAVFKALEWREGRKPQGRS